MDLVIGGLVIEVSLIGFKVGQPALELFNNILIIGNSLRTVQETLGRIVYYRCIFVAQIIGYAVIVINVGMVFLPVGCSLCELLLQTHGLGLKGRQFDFIHMTIQNVKGSFIGIIRRRSCQGLLIAG